MMKKYRFRPFWSYDVLKTEAWLETKSEQGLHLSHVLFKKRVFVFDDGAQEKRRYFINYERGSNGVSETLIKATDYKQVCHNKHYYVLTSQSEVPNYTLSHDGIVKKNEKIRMVAGIFLLYQLIGVIPLFLVGLMMLFSNDFTITYDSSSFIDTAISSHLQIVLTVINALFAASIFLGIVYAYFKLGKSNQRLRQEGMPESVDSVIFSTPTKAELNSLKMQKKLVKRIKLAWMYAPDKLQSWLESQEQKGLNLLYVSRVGTKFYFIKGTPQHVVYHIDYQDTRNLEYFSINKESGWNLIFTSLSKRFAYSIWRQDYDQNQPSFYSDQETKVSHAKKLAVHHGAFMLPVSVLYIFLIISFLRTHFQEPNTPWRFGMILNIIIYSVVAFEFSYFAFKSIRYYFRVKKTQ